MTWVKIPDTWFDEETVEALDAEAVLFHLSALAHSARHGRDGRVPPTAIRRFWLVPDPLATIRQLVIAGWWAPLEAGGWEIREWRTFILSAEEIEHRREQSRVTSERHRRHKSGDHSMCDRCSVVKRRDASRDPSVIPLDSTRLDPKGRGEGESAGPDSAGAPSDLRRLPFPPHAFGDDCCPLPPENPIHQETA